MKYENAAQAFKIVEEINKANSLLNDLNSDNLLVTISEGANKINTIGCGSNEHAFGMYAKELVNKCRSHVATKISNLKEELDQL